MPQLSAEDLGGWQLEARVAVARRPDSGVREPQSPVDGTDTDCAVALTDNLAGWSGHCVFLVGAVDIGLLAQQAGQDTGAAIRRPDPTRNLLRRVGGPVDGTVALAHGGSPPPLYVPPAVVERVGSQGSVGDTTHGRKHGFDRGFRHLTPVQAALGHRLGWQCEAFGRPDGAGVQFGVCLEDGHAPALGAERDGPVQRGRTAITLDAWMDDQTAMVAPDLLWDNGLQHGRDHQVGATACYRADHVLGRPADAEPDRVAAPAQLDEQALAQAVVYGGDEQYSHPDLPRMASQASGTISARADEPDQWQYAPAALHGWSAWPRLHASIACRWGRGIGSGSLHFGGGCPSFGRPAGGPDQRAPT